MSFIHMGYECNGCQTKPIRGNRWHCYICKRAGKDFNICDYCNKKFDHPHELGAIKRHTEKVKEVHKVRAQDKREAYVVDPNKYDYSPAKLNARFANKILEEPLEKGAKPKKRSNHARPHPPDEEEDYSYEEEKNYFADLL
jgi:Zinc finger, ZZ type